MEPEADPPTQARVVRRLLDDRISFRPHEVKAIAKLVGDGSGAA